MGGEELRAEFERLGEVAVVDGILNKSFDHYKRAYALRWLSDHALARLRKEEAALKTRRAAILGGRRRVLLLAFAAAILVLAAALAWTNIHPSGGPSAHRSETPHVLASPRGTLRYG